MRLGICKTSIVLKQKKKKKLKHCFGPEGVTNRLKYDFGASNMPTF